MPLNRNPPAIIVAGESIPIASPNTNGLQDKRFAESIIFTINKKSIRVHHANKDLSFGFILFISGGGSVKGDCAIYICGSTYTGGKPDSCYIYGNIPQSMYLGYESQSDGSLDIYLYTDGIFGSYRVLKKSIHESSNVAMMEADGVDVSSIIKVDIKR